jgi:exopolysaccharide production protein ExoY
MSHIYNLTKRLIDIAASLVLAALFLPIWAIIPLLMKIEHPDYPILYRPDRVGKDGNLFKLLKFRSMIMLKNKDGKLEHAVGMWKKNKKLFEKYKKAGWKLEIDDDPRITKLGKFLRQTSIDEMPQVFNILNGDMSLVGPRAYVQPEIDDALKRYGKKQIGPHINASLSVKPGLTGPWQVAGRNEIPWNKRVKMDAAYAKRKSLLEDFLIIFKTPFAMISKW